MDFRKFFGTTARPIQLFENAGHGRENNDSNNKIREKVLVSLYNSTDPSLQTLRELWKMFLKTLCSEPYDDVSVRQYGGRGANYDFEITFTHQQKLVKTVKAEFKHNVNRIDKLPEYFSPAADKPYIPQLYADAFYERLDSICDIYPGLNEFKPDRQTYIRLVHNDSYDRHPFFRKLYEFENSGTREQYNKKREVVRDSIREYLNQNIHNIDLQKLSKDIEERQSGKIFILWDLKGFRSDRIEQDEMKIEYVEGVKNENTLVVVSKAGTKHNMLLRWKNHLGILYPAWQISLTR